ncbi:hypothetical protein BATDEDRAFT_17183 [Batrachochytrium dendrobatidis JAM81]|uniref:Importin-95 n=1 Tax=Batrachochytrium dendrobatidis (strain JAM81 / FGSC 10211) TaxID=684364 RepID=F4P6U2_BATDJ|nr:karyopherin beta [Batrachochytrium dendrobatidis JAM81]EGF79070.1 hypothetical protein BATDEDRAFT_17183 [Batrachochytrium dendrobatidis JAM81]|eukprot:XP_006680271.1 hypothetical protein BATDEDRAFT_17183 [Batrachochytrium dendrobatidis JAM81]
MSIAELLANTLSPTQTIREDATNKLNSYESENFPNYLGLLCQELTSQQTPMDIRKSAGLIFKNSLTSRDAVRQTEMAARWRNIDPAFRTQVKTAILLCIAAPVAGPSKVSGQVAAAIAAIELPHDEWPDLISSLLEKVTTSEADVAKQACLQTIGYICESIEPSVLRGQSNAILNAVAHGARKEETNNAVRLCAIQALFNSLSFVRDNFENEGERNYIMQIVCEATQCSDAEVQVVAFECLVKIMSLYYEKMVFYMQKALYGLTVLGMRHDNEKVVLQAVEFWSTVAETELDILYEHQDALEANEQPERELFHFASTALPQIVPVLLWLMTKQDEDDDEDTWNISMASATCLSLFATCCADAIVPLVLPTIESNIKNEDWKFREAAVMAFGAILEGPDPTQLGNLVQMAFPTLLELMNDNMEQVKETAAWTLSRISQNLIQFVTFEQFPVLISTILKGLSDNPRVSTHCAWCIINLAENTTPTSDNPEIEFAETSPLSSFFEPIVSALHQCGEAATNAPHLRASVFEAMATVIATSADDCLGSVQNLTTVLLQRLNESVNVQSQLVGADERRVHHDLQAHLCSVLTAAIRRLKNQIAQIADPIMSTMLLVISNAPKASTVMEDAFLVCGALAAVIEGNFLRYVNTLLPYVSSAMQNVEEYQVCITAIGLIGDICRAVGESILPYCEGIMGALGSLIQNPSLHRSIKPACLAVFGDMCLAIGNNFEPFLQPTMMATHQLSESLNQMPTVSDALIYEYIYLMREGIAEAYVGIVQGLKASDRGRTAQLITPYAHQIFAFLEAATAQEDRTESVTRSILGLIGDLGELLPLGTMKPLFSAEWIPLLLKEVKVDRNASISTKEVGRWAREMVRRQVSV